jgi:hypothetical protein
MDPDRQLIEQFRQGDRDAFTVLHRWFSDELKLLIRSVTSDPRDGVVSYELTDIVQAPPHPSLFQIPAGFVESVETKKPR